MAAETSATSSSNSVVQTAINFTKEQITRLSTMTEQTINEIVKRVFVTCLTVIGFSLLMTHSFVFSSLIFNACLVTGFLSSCAIAFKIYNTNSKVVFAEVAQTAKQMFKGVLNQIIPETSEIKS